MICTIDNTTITKGTEISINSAIPNTGAEPEAILLSDNKVFITYIAYPSKYSNNYNLYGMVCTIDNTTITKGTVTLLNNSEDFISQKNMVLLSENNIFIEYIKQDTSNKYLYGMVCKIEGETITVEINTSLNMEFNILTFTISTIRLSSSKVLIIHTFNENSYLYGMVCMVGEEGIASLYDSQDKILGVSKNKGIEGQIVKVYIPNLLKYLSTENEDIIITENEEEIRNE